MRPMRMFSIDTSKGDMTDYRPVSETAVIDVEFPGSFHPYSSLKTRVIVSTSRCCSAGTESCRR